MAPVHILGEFETRRAREYADVRVRVATSLQQMPAMPLPRLMEQVRAPALAQSPQCLRTERRWGEQRHFFRSSKHVADQNNSTYIVLADAGYVTSTTYGSAETAGRATVTTIPPNGSQAGYDLLLLF